LARADAAAAALGSFAFLAAWAAWRDLTASSRAAGIVLGAGGGGADFEHPAAISDIAMQTADSEIRRHRPAISFSRMT
jgi:hypothetical protein